LALERKPEVKRPSTKETVRPSWGKDTLRLIRPYHSELQPGGFAVSHSLLIEYYSLLPQGLAGEDSTKERKRRQMALEQFRGRVTARYTEGTLLRLLSNPENATRRAALLALQLTGTMESNAAVAAQLHDEDAELARLAAEALWAIWFRGDNPANSEELKRLTVLGDRKKALAGLDRLIKQAPHFAEAYNQRAIALFQLEQFERSLSDCERTLQLNAYHFGAQAGMGRCLLRLHKYKAALKAFRNALRINPHLDGIAETIRTLENAPGEEGRRDDKK
jgi:tetratricopeptide (TPR) repeat protein